MKNRSISFLFALVILGRTSVPASTYTWVGNAPPPFNNQDWGTAQNWSPHTGVPGAGDTAIIGGNQTVQVNSAITVDSVSLGSTYGSTLTGGGSLTITRQFLCQASGLQVTGGITVNGSMSIEPATPTVPISTVYTLLTINGSCTVSANAALWFNSNAQLVNNGSFTVADGASVVVPSSSSGVLIINNSSGNFIGGNAYCSTSSSVFSNAPNGTVQINAGATFQFQGTLANSGAINVGGGGTASISANSAFHGGGSCTGGGTVVLTGNNTLDGTVTVSGNVQMNSSALTLNGVLEVQGGGNFNWLGGTLTGVGTNVTGTIQVDAAGTMLVNQVTGQTLRNCNVTNNGNLNWTNNGTIFMGYHAQIVNQHTFNILGDGSLEPLAGGSPGYDAASLYNGGPGISTIFKYSGATNSATLINVPCYGPIGDVWVYQGKLLFDGGGDIGYMNATAATIQLGNGNYTAYLGKISGFNAHTNLPVNFIMSPGVAINIPSGGTLQISYGGNFQQEGGAISGAGYLFVDSGGFFTWSGGTIALTNAAGLAGMNIDQGGTMNLSGANNGTTLKGCGIKNNGVINWINDNSAGGMSFWDNTFIDNFGAFNIQCSASLYNSAVLVNPVFTNEPTGIITKSASPATSYFGFNTVNLGTIQAQSGTLEFYLLNNTQGFGGGIIMQGGNLTFDSSQALYGTLQGSGQITVQSGGGGLTVEGKMEADSLPVLGNLVNDAEIDLGDAPGVMPLSNNFNQTTNGLLVVPIRGTNIATMDFGRMTGYGFATLAGTLEAQIMDGYAPPIGATFPFLANFYAREGTFNNLILPPGMTISYTSSGATLVVTGAVPVQILSPAVTNGQFQFGFNTISNRSYTVQYKDNLTAGTWIFLTNFIASGAYWQPPLLSLAPQRFYRVSNP
jgi:hypothetical protein